MLLWSLILLPGSDLLLLNASSSLLGVQTFLSDTAAGGLRDTQGGADWAPSSLDHPTGDPAVRTVQGVEALGHMRHREN